MNSKGLSIAIIATLNSPRGLIFQRRYMMATTTMGIHNYWLVVSTPLKNISQWEGLSDILWKIKNV